MMPSAEPQDKKRPARLVLADDSDLVRAGLVNMLADEPDLVVVGEASNGRQALDLCRQLRPDLALLDVRMPEMDGLATARAIKVVSPGTSLVMLTMHENPEYLLEAFRAGAAGYLLKDLTRDDLLAAIRQVLRGEGFLNNETAVRILQRLAMDPPRPVVVAAAPEAPPPSLTQREKEVLQLLVQGNTNREIGKALFLSPGTIKIHVEHILAKLGVSDRTQAAVKAVEMGLVRRDNNARPAAGAAGAPAG